MGTVSLATPLLMCASLMCSASVWSNRTYMGRITPENKRGLPVHVVFRRGTIKAGDEPPTPSGAPWVTINIKIGPAWEASGGCRRAVLDVRDVAVLSLKPASDPQTGRVLGWEFSIDEECIPQAVVSLSRPDPERAAVGFFSIDISTFWTQWRAEEATRPVPEMTPEQAARLKRDREAIEPVEEELERKERELKREWKQKQRK